MSLFLLEFNRYWAPGLISCFRIGVFSTEAEAKNAVKALSTKPGYRDAPNIVERCPNLDTPGFAIFKCQLDELNIINESKTN